MTKSIPLTQGKFAIVDDGDFEYLSQFNWTFDHGYAKRNIKCRRKMYMHREIMNTPHDLITDHINGDGLDNRKENLRICSKAENAWNAAKPINNKSGYKGVVWHKGAKKWTAQIWHNNLKTYLGLFDSVEAAIEARDKAALKYHGNFARINSGRIND